MLTLSIIILSLASALAPSVHSSSMYRLTILSIRSCAILTAYLLPVNAYSLYNNLFLMNDYTYLLSMTLLLIAIIILVGQRLWQIQREYVLLILFTMLGGLLLIARNDLIRVYLALELQSFALYGLCVLSHNKVSSSSNAGLTYFILGSFSTAILLFGIAMIYNDYGTTNLEYLQAVSFDRWGSYLVIRALLFKLAAAPLHFWAPSVYDGVDTNVTIWITTMPKITVWRILITMTRQHHLYIIALLCLLIGSVYGLTQRRVKRLLTYSTISHVGFILLGLGAGTEGTASSLYYILQYRLTNALIFLLILSLTAAYPALDLDYILQYRSCFKQSYIRTIGLVMCLFSLAGIPPFIGWYAKYSIISVLVDQGQILSALLAIFCSTIRAGYYLRMIYIIWFNPDLSTTRYTPYKVNYLTARVISILSLTILLLLFRPLNRILVLLCHIAAISF